MARTDDDLLSLFKSPESANLERKRNANDLDRLREIICGFANDIENTGQTGIVIIGQEDDLSCSKTNIDDELLKTLAGLRSDGRIQPLPMMNVAAKTIDGCKIAVIEVFPSDNPPVRCNGRTWIRIGPTRAQATPAEEKRLVEKRVWGSLSFDAQTCKGATIDDLDLKRFQLEFLPALVPRDVLIENHRDESLQLCSFRLVDRDNRPTNAGILFLAKSVLDWIPSAYIQFRRVDGTELTDDTLDAQQIMGTLPNQLQQLDNLLPLHIRKITRVGGNLRNEESDYPIVALRQLVRNAVIHRAYDGTNSPVRITWYDDRIEIQSPGGPYGIVNAENFGSGLTDYRNPTVTGLLFQLGYIEKYGVGIQIARRALEANENPPLEFVTNTNQVLAIVKAKR